MLGTSFSVWHQEMHAHQLKRSCSFPAGRDGKTEWSLNLYHTTNAVQGKCCDLCFELVIPQETLDSQCRLSFALLVSSTRYGDNVFYDRTVILEASWFGSYHLKLKCAELLSRKHTDKLHVKCTVTATDGNLDQTKEIQQVSLRPLPGKLSADLNALVDGNTFGDVAILVGDQRFLAYKGVLSVRSSVFAAMFNHPMQENIENSVTINDVEPEVFKELLRYIYTDEVTCLETMAFKLYATADKYALSTLKSICRCHILKTLSLDTGIKTLMLGDTHSDRDMKEYTLQFLSRSGVAGKLTSTADWKKMFLTHPHLVNETFDALARKVASTEE